MLESTQHSFFRHYPVSKAEKPNTDIGKQYVVKYQYYISPEDTTGYRDERQRRVEKYHPIHIPGVIKTALWIAVSIGLSLLIGTLN